MNYHYISLVGYIHYTYTFYLLNNVLDEVDYEHKIASTHGKKFAYWLFNVIKRNVLTRFKIFRMDKQKFVIGYKLIVLSITIFFNNATVFELFLFKLYELHYWIIYIKAFPLIVMDDHLCYIWEVLTTNINCLLYSILDTLTSPHDKLWLIS